MLAEGPKTRRRRKGTERVKAWIYSVMNPLMEDLLAENKLLAKKDITWRYQTAEMEFIKRTRELVSPSARPNFDDLLRGRPDLQPLIAERDTKFEILNKSALDCWKHLTEGTWFQSHVQQNLQMWIDEGNPYPGGPIPEKEFWQLIAEYLINNTQTLPFHYSSQQFWSRFRAVFFVFRASAPFPELERAIIELKKTNEGLIETFDQTRSYLCEEYDIPAAPIS